MYSNKMPAIDKMPTHTKDSVSTVPTVYGTIMSRQNTNQRKQAMSDIEASVTKLLIATKQLLECLTQWSRLEASESDVSDIYVSLGNEFNRATISFQNAGIDMSDLENTPIDLRNILERALGEEASISNLDKFLPRIREIIINLLQGLKRKQQIHRIQSGEAAAPTRMRRTESQNSQKTNGSRGIDIDTSRQGSASPSITNFRTQQASTNASYSASAKRQLPTLPGPNTSPSQILPPRKAPTPPISNRDMFTPAPAIIANSDPVTQLSQMTLERRSSKRFSENYLAQLTSSPNSDRSGKLSVDNVRKQLHKVVSIPETIEDDGSYEQAEYSAGRAYGSPPQFTASHSDSIATTPTLPSPAFKVIEAPRVRDALTDPAKSVSTRSSTVGGAMENSQAGTDSIRVKSLPLICFVKHRQQTKKLSLDFPTSFSNLYEAISRTFGTLDAYKLYMEDETSKVAYELEDINDIKQRSVLTVRFAVSDEKENLEAPTKIDNSELRSWLDERLQKLSEQLTDAKITISAMSTTRMSAVEQEEHHTQLPSIPVMEEPAASIAQTEVDNSETIELKAKIDELQAALAASTEAAPALVVSANRDHVMSMSAKHEHRGTELTAKLEEAMNVMERIRKDVLQRKVTPRPQQLTDLSKEFDDIAKESSALAQNLVLLDAASNKLWEEELTIITSEQDALEYQKAFVEDIKADLEQSLSSLSTIKQVEEQKRNVPSTSVPTMIDTTIDPSRALKFVQADIKSLKVNHERRTAAIADAEKQRIKDREYLLENEFKNELGSFVGSNALKNTGGAAEIDRLREEKDSLHRKQWYSKPVTPQSEPQTRDVSPESIVPRTVPEIEVSKPVNARDAQNNGKTEVVPAATRVVSSSASILAKIDAAKNVDVLDRRRSSIMTKSLNLGLSSSIDPNHAYTNEASLEKDAPLKKENGVEETTRNTEKDDRDTE